MLYDILSVCFKIIILEDGIEVHIEGFIIRIHINGLHLLDIDILTFVKK